MEKDNNRHQKEVTCAHAVHSGKKATFLKSGLWFPNASNNAGKNEGKCCIKSS